MKSLILLFFPVTFFAAPVNWTNDFEQAKKTAVEKHEMILLNFSGSDWCGPCIRLKKEVFESDAFAKYAEGNLVLVNADFPRLSKHQLDKKQVIQNEKLADQYNPHGHFPYTVLLSADGKVIKTWNGLPEGSADAFVKELTLVSHDAR